MALQLLQDSYPQGWPQRSLRRLPARKTLRSLELDGLVTGRRLGRTRLYEINPRYYARTEVLAYAGKLADADQELQERLTRLRRRPRRLVSRLDAPSFGA
ncbi:MAG: hypothetical protein HYS05_07255 [Acidobacteria bacterium]|nr:hypothetical protein [Acidobacteriota bacterium]